MIRPPRLEAVSQPLIATRSVSEGMPRLRFGLVLKQPLSVRAEASARTPNDLSHDLRRADRKKQASARRLRRLAQGGKALAELRHRRIQPAFVVLADRFFHFQDMMLDFKGTRAQLSGF